MKTLLMFEDRDFTLPQQLPENAPALIQDLELNILLEAMAAHDPFLLEVAKQALLSGVYNDMATILYRQEILQDCLKHSSIIKTLYALSLEAIERKKKSWFGVFAHYPTSILTDAIEILHIFMGILKKLRHIADQQANLFSSRGFTQFFNRLKTELSDDYFAQVHYHLDKLKFRDGLLISAQLGTGNKGVHYTLLKLPDKKPGWLQRLFSKKSSTETFHIHQRDGRGASALSELKDQSINSVANTVAQTAEHILGFFNQLRIELAFYISCLHLHTQLKLIDIPTSFPHPVTTQQRKQAFTSLHDVCLALSTKQKVVSNDMNADDKTLVLITGANQGGKSTFLRSIGVSQLMMQCGLFVTATSFDANLCNGLFTHFRREEDTTMTSGKLDEELSRMNDIIHQITANSMILFNESFAATNEREGSEIAKQIVNALTEKQIKVFFITHLYEFAASFHEKTAKHVLLLSAKRNNDGTRSFQITPGEPSTTSYGMDLYQKIF